MPVTLHLLFQFIYSLLTAFLKACLFADFVRVIVVFYFQYGTYLLFTNKYKYTGSCYFSPFRFFPIFPQFVLFLLKTISLMFPRPLRGLLHEIFGPVFWTVWIDLGLNRNRFWLLSFKEAPLIWDRPFKFWCFSFQTFSEILRISEKDWQLNSRFLEIYLKLLWDTLMLWKNILGEPRTQLPFLLQELGTQCQSFSEILRIAEKYLHPKRRFSENR